jgi:two-component system, OmpR family, response regulator
MRALVVEDELKMAALIRRGLAEEGYAADVARTGEEALWMARATPYDAIVLDVMLPGQDGLEVCRSLRESGVWSPILLLTARDGLEDKVSGLDSGADDYLTKPFAFEELLARIRALLRRSDLTRPPAMKVADLVLDPVTHRVTRSGAEIRLTPKEYAILETLMRHAGQVVTRTRIGESVWEEGPPDLANLVDVHVSHLRRKVDQGEGPQLIHTVRALGFRLGEGQE